MSEGVAEAGCDVRDGQRGSEAPDNARELGAKVDTKPSEFAFEVRPPEFDRVQLW
jgi:hypothetical protein